MIVLLLWIVDICLYARGRRKENAGISFSSFSSIRVIQLKGSPSTNSYLSQWTTKVRGRRRKEREEKLTLHIVSVLFITIFSRTIFVLIPTRHLWVIFQMSSQLIPIRVSVSQLFCIVVSNEEEECQNFDYFSSERERERPHVKFRLHGKDLVWVTLYHHCTLSRSRSTSFELTLSVSSPSIRLHYSWKPF